MKFFFIKGARCACDTRRCVRFSAYETLVFGRFREERIKEKELCLRKKETKREKKDLKGPFSWDRLKVMVKRF